MADQAAQGKKLLAESKYSEAVEQFTQALKQSPTSPDYLIQRSIAYQRSKQYEEALQDAETAVVYAHKRAKREFIIQAQLRRGIALFNLERYGDAKFTLDIVKRMDAKEKSVDIWLNKTAKKLADSATEDEKSAVTVKEVPEIDTTKSEPAANTNVGGTSTRTAETQAQTLAQPTPADKIRHDWYQNPSTVYFTLLARGVPQDKATVEITEASLSISFPIEATASTYDYTIDPFFAHVDQSKSSFRILPSKVEVTLVKATPGQKWATLEGSEPLAASDATDDSQTQSKIPAAVINSQAPAYPTSARGGPKNWDKIVDEQSTGKDDLDDYEGGDDATKFFKQLYKGASPETQRAMMKSYTESNGTALSTDWKEVSKKKVETLPPDGMEAKQWSK